MHTCLNLREWAASAVRYKLTCDRNGNSCRTPDIGIAGMRASESAHNTLQASNALDDPNWTRGDQDKVASAVTAWARSKGAHMLH